MQGGIFYFILWISFIYYDYHNHYYNNILLYNIYLIINKITNYFQVIKNKNLTEIIHHFVLLF